MKNKFKSLVVFLILINLAIVGARLTTTVDAQTKISADVIKSSNGDQIAPSVLQHTVTLTSAQIKNLLATPVTLIPAPGPNKEILPQFIILHLNAGATVPYDTGTGYVAYIGDIANTQFPWGSTFGMYPLDRLEGNAIYQYGISNSGISGPNAQLINQPLSIANNSGAEFANGDGTLTITVYYSVVTLQ